MIDNKRALNKRLDGSQAPKQQKPLAGYLRLTVDRDGNKIGYEVQKKAITAWAELTGNTIGKWYKDKDLTAADINVIRPEYEQMLKDIEAGMWGGIAVWRLDRLVRMAREFERVNGVIEDTKGYIMSIEPMLNTRDDMGKFVMRLLVMIAEMEISAMKVRQRGHQRAKAEAGKYSGGGSRAFGFEGAIKDEDGRILNAGRIGVAHVPHEAALIREAARRVAWDGETLSDVIRDWNQRTPPIVGSTGSPFVVETLYRILSSPRVVGLREHTVVDPDTDEKRTDLFPAEWEAILEQETWDRIRALKVHRPRKGRPYSYLLAGGIAVCSACGKRMIGGKMRVPDVDTGENVDHPAYMCDASPAAKMQGACGSNKIYASVVESLVVEAIMKRLEETPELIDAVAAENNTADPRVSTALDTIASCDRRLEEFAKLAALPPERGGITTAEFLAFRTSVWDQRQAAAKILDAARLVQSVPTPIGDERNDLRAWFDKLVLTQKRAFVQAHVRTVIIQKGKRGGSPAFKAKQTLGRIVPLFADAQQLNGGGDDAGVLDLNLDALIGADAS